MVGHPETEEDFDELLNLLNKTVSKGRFPYSHEEGTYADKNIPTRFLPK